MVETTIDDAAEVQNKGHVMLEHTSWIKVNNQHHSLVDPHYKIIANIYSTFSEED